jgi:urea transporter/murein DD-endopeptidase MepM/ murein hydrolase activator NlpD
LAEHFTLMVKTATFNKSDPGLFFNGVMNSYSQVFFSDNRVFSAVILLVTFIDPFAGLWGLVSVLFTNIMGLRLGFNKYVISKGLYGFNSLLVGLGLGVYFAPGWHLLLIVLLAAVLTLFISVAAEGVIGKYALPYLSVPFIISIWIVMLSTRDLTALGISQRGVFTLNDLYSTGGHTLVRLYEWWQQLSFPPSLRVYFISLGALFFQFNVLSGVILAGGLLYFSRIAFTLTLVGFYSAFYFYEIIGADLDELNYSYIGFNYILTSVAVGGFFIIPTLSSYICVICLIPLVALLTLSLGSVFAVFNLPVYSLPFNIIVLLFLYVLKFRTKNTSRLHTMFYQYNSPERNLYAFRNSSERLARLWDVQMRLPFFGEWTVTQSYEGEHTHRGEWRHALDFEIMDDKGKSYRGKGDLRDDYYCYDKAVLAPADGTVEEVTDNIPDNTIGNINLVHNWGNTIIIKHAEGLYSKLSHLREKSAEIKQGEKVRQGQTIARCGNSGRSPVPHLHFQLQGTPWIGSETMEYPLSHYVLKQERKFEFRSFDVPEKNDRIRNVEINSLLKNAFDFVPGRKIRIIENRKGQEARIEWEVQASIYNKSFIFCKKTNSRAWFENDGTIWYFTHFEGDRSSLLHYFYLAAFQVQFGFYQDIELNDKFPVNQTFKRGILFLQDLVAPFFIFLKSLYNIGYVFIDDTLSPEKINLRSEVNSYAFGRLTRRIQFEMVIDQEGLKRFTAESGELKITGEREK